MKRALYYGKDERGGFDRPIIYAGPAWAHGVRIVAEWMTTGGLRLMHWSERWLNEQERGSTP